MRSGVSEVAKERLVSFHALIDHLKHFIGIGTRGEEIVRQLVDPFAVALMDDGIYRLHRPVKEAVSVREVGGAGIVEGEILVEAEVLGGLAFFPSQVPLAHLVGVVPGVAQQLGDAGEITLQTALVTRGRLRHSWRGQTLHGAQADSVPVLAGHKLCTRGSTQGRGMEIGELSALLGQGIQVRCVIRGVRVFSLSPGTVATRPAVAAPSITA